MAILRRKDSEMGLYIWRSRLAAINRVFAKIWTELGIDVSSKEFLEQFLPDPTIENLRRIYFADEPDEYRQYMRAHFFNIVCDHYFSRTGRSLRIVDPRLAEWNYDRWGVEPISKNMAKYIEVVTTETVIGRHDVEKPYTYIVEEPDPEYRNKTRTVQHTKIIEVTVEDTATLKELRFNEEFLSKLRVYELNKQEDKRYKQLLDVCEALNTLYKGAPYSKRSDFMALLYLDPKTQQFRPTETVDANTLNF